MLTRMEMPHSETAEPRKPSLKERQWQLREDAILDTAQEILCTRGLASMTLDDLIAEVGISKPTLYQHFHSKEDVVGSIMTRCLRQSQRKLQELSASLPPGQALRQLIGWFVESNTKNDCGPMTDLCVTLSLMAQGPVREAERALCHEIELLVEAAHKEGSVRSGVPSMFVSQTLLSISKDWTYRDLLADGRTDVPTMVQAVTQMLLGDPPSK